jgi:hypothetical protein
MTMRGVLFVNFHVRQGVRVHACFPMLLYLLSYVYKMHKPCTHILYCTNRDYFNKHKTHADNCQLTNCKYIMQPEQLCY